MNSRDFKNWREAMGFTQGQAAQALDISKPTVENYERGKRREDDRSVVIPLAVSLACSALYHRNQPWELEPINKHLVKEAEKAEAKKRGELMKALVAGIVEQNRTERP